MPPPQQIANKVGRQPARNEPSDIDIVSDLLMRVPAANGGPDKPIFSAPFPGMASPSLVSAIDKFQLHQFGKGDGRVDPRGPTLARLNQVTNNGATAKRTIVPFVSVFQTSVGRAPAPNRFDDVVKLVGLLRLAPPSEGGAGLGLAMPAMPGQVPSTLVPAIENFQRRQFGASDGRVDPGQKTEIRLRQLVKLPA